jgi:hypothetical protein
MYRTKHKRGCFYAVLITCDQRTRQSVPMVTRRDVWLADGGLKCLWRRHVDVVNLIAGTSSGGARYSRIMHGRNLRLDGHEHHRCGR